MLSGAFTSADTDELGPHGSEYRADQHVMGTVAERAAILAHGRAEIADLMFAGEVEKPRQDCERSSYKPHSTLRKGIKPIGITLAYRVSKAILARGYFESENKLKKIFDIAASAAAGA